MMNSHGNNQIKGWRNVSLESYLITDAQTVSDSNVRATQLIICYLFY